MNGDEAMYQLRTQIHEVMDSTDLASPDEIAAKVAEQVPEDSLREVLMMALREYVRVELSLSRSRGLAAAGSARSAKVAAIRSAAPGWLRERVSVDSDWKMIGDCTFDDLRWLEADRAAQAARFTSAAARFGRLAELVSKHHRRRVADLPRRVLEQFEAVS